MAFFVVTLRDGQKIAATELHAARTYAFLHEGAPRRRTNDSILANLPKKLTKLFNYAIPVFIIEPERRVGEPDPNENKFILEKLGPQESLPPYWFAVEFQGPKLRVLGVVWFQNEPMPFPSDKIRAKLKALDWEGHAEFGG